MIELKHPFTCSADTLWAIMGDPSRYDWVPGVTSLLMEANVRTMQMAGAGQVSERIFERDAERRHLAYGVIESTPPLAHHRASMTVDPSGEGCMLTWRTEVEPTAVEPFIEQSMQACLAQLERLTGGSEAST